MMLTVTQNKNVIGLCILSHHLWWLGKSAPPQHNMEEMHNAFYKIRLIFCLSGLLQRFLMIGFSEPGNSIN